MNIDFAKNFGGTVGFGVELTGIQADGSKISSSQSKETPRTPSTLTIGEGHAPLASAEPVSNIPDSALAKDDPLGKLISSAFNLPPPPMPMFS